MENGEEVIYTLADGSTITVEEDTPSESGLLRVRYRHRANDKTGTVLARCLLGWRNAKEDELFGLLGIPKSLKRQDEGAAPKQEEHTRARA